MVFIGYVELDKERKGLLVKEMAYVMEDIYVTVIKSMFQTRWLGQIFEKMSHIRVRLLLKNNGESYWMRMKTEVKTQRVNSVDTWGERKWRKNNECLIMKWIT